MMNLELSTIHKILITKLHIIIRFSNVKIYQNLDAVRGLFPMISKCEAKIPCLY